MEIDNRIMALLDVYFNGDNKKVSAWLNTKNPSLGNASPCAMILSGKQEKLLNWMQGQRDWNRS